MTCCHSCRNIITKGMMYQCSKGHKRCTCAKDSDVCKKKTGAVLCGCLDYKKGKPKKMTLSYKSWRGSRLS